MQTFDTTVETVSPRKWKDLFRQRIRWYKGSVDNAIIYKKLMFNKKYGDFGMIRMPTIILSGIIAITLCATIFYEIIKIISNSFSSLKAINFDILTLIKNYSFNFNILGLPFAKLLIAGTLILITLFVMVYSFKIVKEKIRHYGRTWVSMFTYIFIYSMFISVVWVYIAFMMVTKKKNFWS